MRVYMISLESDSDVVLKKFDFNIFGEKFNINYYTDFYYPVSPIEIGVFKENLFRHTIDYILPKLGNHNLIKIVYMHFLNQLLNCIDSELLYVRLQKRHYDIDNRLKCPLIEAMYNNQEHKSPLEKLLERGYAEKSHAHLLLRKIRRTINQKQYSIYIDKKCNFDSAIVCNYIDSQLSLFLDKMGCELYFIRPEYWFATLNKERKQSTDIKLLADDLIILTKNYFRNINYDISDALFDYLYQWLIKVLVVINSYFSRLLLFKNIPQQAVLNTGGSIWSRMLARAIQLKGGEVYRLGHGAGLSWRKGLISQAHFNFDDCSKYYVMSESELNLFSNTNNLLSYSQDTIEFDIIRQNKNAIRKVKRKKYDKNISIMHVSTVYRNYQHNLLVNNPSWHIYADWQLRLTTKLKKFGYKIKLKPPFVELSSIKPPTYVLDSYDYVFEQRFEEVYHLVDLVIIDCLTTSLFPKLIACNIPIVYVDFDYVTLEGYAFDLLKKRCAVVSANYSDTNQIIVDWGELELSIAKAFELNSNEFYDYCFK